MNGIIPVYLLYNNLSGAVSHFNAQFRSFKRNRYEVCPFLYGDALDNKCGSPKLSNTSKINRGKESSNLVDIRHFYIGFVVSYGSILLGLATVLCVNCYWRKSWLG